MIKIVIFPGSVIEVDLPSGHSISEILDVAQIDVDESQSVFVGRSKVSHADFDKIHVIDGYVIVAKGVRGEVPTPKVRKVVKFLKVQGFSLVSGGKGDHMKFKNLAGETVIINRDNRDKQVVCLGSVKSLSGIFNLSPVQLFHECR
jgi:predicted RNA binding protein YcfA (HicA-like mRNA interferase family)